eukprot:SM003142S12001  [mRNA]  locus=s3142:39:215:+ [translate_table: standard]
MPHHSDDVGIGASANCAVGPRLLLSTQTLAGRVESMRVQQALRHCTHAPHRSWFGLDA